MNVSTSTKEIIDYEPGKDCPNCGQMVWDNTKKPKLNKNSPDFKCSNKAECGLAMWIKKENNKPAINKDATILKQIFEVLMQIEFNTRH